MDMLKNLANLSNRDSNTNQENGNKVMPIDEDQPLKEQEKKSFKGFSDGLQQMANTSLQKAKANYENAKAEMKQGFTQLDDKLKTMLRSYTFQINQWARIQVQNSIITVLEKMRPLAKQSLKDPDMCQCVKNLIDDGIDDIWPEIMDETKYQLMMALQDPYTEIPDKKTIICCTPFVWFRNWYLYSTKPFNRTIWKQMRTISWWFWSTISAIPYYGVSQYFYVFDFFLIDKQDEYQLVTFILSFKTMFFITQGVMKALIGYFILYSCTTMSYSSSTNQTDSCSRKGPGASIEVFSEVIGQLLQVVLIWVAFLMLPCSQQKGRPIFFYEDVPKQLSNNCFERGGRIKYFMIYDFFALGASIGLFWLVYLITYSPDFDRSGDFIYFAEICYGLLSFPFLLFSLPFVNGRLTKAKPTAYDRKGNCIPHNKDLRQVQTEGKLEEKSLLSSLTIDVTEVFDG